MLRRHIPANATPSDPGATPTVLNIEKLTRDNPNYRTALWTGRHLQLTEMTIPVGGDIGVEIHPDTDQFFRIVTGTGRVDWGPTDTNLNHSERVGWQNVILIPAGTWHNISNIGSTPLRLYTIYAPPHHPQGVSQATKEEARAAER